MEGLALDISNPDQVSNAASSASDVTLVINNAGVASGIFIVGSSDTDGLKRYIEVNVLGTTDMIRKFAPVLEANGGGAMVVVSSVASFVNFPCFGGYSASKAALHSITQGVRAELSPRGVLVTVVYPGPIDTDMAEQMAANIRADWKAVEKSIAGMA